MKRPIRLLLASLTAIAALDAAAAPPQRADLPANPAWLLHMDCDALRQTYLGKYVLYEFSKPEMYSNIVSFESVFGFDFRTNLHGITVYGGSAPRDYVVITYADFVPDRIIKLIQQFDSAQTTTYHGHQIYSWIDKGQNPADANVRRSYASLLKDRWIGGGRKDSMISELRVIDGTLPNLSTGAAMPEMAIAGDTLFLQAVAARLVIPDSQPGASLFKLAQRIELRAAETNEQITASLALKAGDEDTAKQMAIAAQGLAALLGLQRNIPDVAKLAAGISVKQNGTTMTATLSAPASDLVAALKVYFAKNGQQKAAAQ